MDIKDYSVINDIIGSWKKDGCRSIAVIGKTSNECENLRNRIGSRPPVISEKTQDYEGGILIVPSYLAKGLEFDGVIISDVSMYSNESLDIKLLYIAMTRALHKLAVLRREIC